MTSVLINRVGTDTVDTEFITSGTHATTTVLREALLDGSKDYVFSIVSLVAPLEGTPMFPITEEFALFEVVRRNVGQSQTADIDVYLAAQGVLDLFVTQSGVFTDVVIQLTAQNLGLGLGAYNRADYIAAITAYYQAQVNAAIATTTVSYLGRDAAYYISPDNPLYSPAQLVQDINRWCRTFNVKQTIQGVTQNEYGGTDTLQLDDDDHLGTVAEQTTNLLSGEGDEIDFLTVMFSADGSLLLQGSVQFWNNFTIRMSNYGRHLFGFQKTAFTTVGESSYIQFTGDEYATNFVNPGNNDVILTGNNTLAHAVRTVVPLYQSCDQRVKVSMHSDLSYPSMVKIDNEVEERDRDICSAFFTNTITSEVEFDEDMEISAVSIRSTVYNGRYAFIKKTDRQHQWTSLSSSFDLRLMRFYLQITYRDFDETADTFTLSKKDMVIPEGSYYQFVVRFVSSV